MPLQGTVAVCVNHPTTQLVADAGFHALTKVEKDAGGHATFSPVSGVPVKVFVCPACGYAELYHASKVGGW